MPAQRSRPNTASARCSHAAPAWHTPQLPAKHRFEMAEDAEPPAKRAKGEEKVEEEQPALPARPNVVRLPGREVNAQRARLWQQLGSNALLFDVTLKASDRDVPCNRCGPLSWFWLRASCAGRMPPKNPAPLFRPSQ